MLLKLLLELLAAVEYSALQIVNAIEIALDVPQTGQLQFFLLEIGHRTCPFDVVDPQREIGIQPVPGRIGSAKTIENPLIDLFGTDLRSAHEHARE